MFDRLIGKYLRLAGFPADSIEHCKRIMQEEYADMNSCLTDDGKIDWRPLCRDCGITYDPSEDYTDWDGWESVFTDIIDEYHETRDIGGLKNTLSIYLGGCSLMQAENLYKYIPQMWEEARKE